MPEREWKLMRGREAFAHDTQHAAQSRAAQILAMSTRAFGSRDQQAAIRAEADELLTPQVLPLAKNTHQHNHSRTPDNQHELDMLTDLTLQRIGHAPGNFYKRPGTPHAGEHHGVHQRLWQLLAITRDPEMLLGMLNFELQDQQDELSRAAAVAALTAPGLPAFEAATRAQEELSRSGNPTVEKLVAALDNFSEEVPNCDPHHHPPHRHLRPDDSVSLTVHGTSARLNEERWYDPESFLSQLIRSRSTPSLYAEPDFFKWTGGYSARARRDGGTMLRNWLVRRNSVVDTLFGHSHGGNVGLHAAANDECIKFLVLMHTPVLPRNDDEWAKIRKNAPNVLVLRSRLDLVVLADGLRTKSKQSISHRDLPHREIMPPKHDKRGWFDHETYTNPENWEEWDLTEEIVHERCAGATKVQS